MFKYSHHSKIISDDQNLQFIFNDGEIDVETVESALFLKSAATNAELLGKFQEEMTNIPFIRRINLKSSPDSAIYLTLGCILLDSIIEDLNSSARKLITAAFIVLINQTNYDPYLQRIYDKANRGYANLIDYIKSERDDLLDTTETSALAKHVLYARVYEKLSTTEEFVTAIVVSVQALFYEYITSHKGDDLYPGFVENVSKSVYFLKDKYIKHACNLFAIITESRVIFLDVNFDATSMYKIRTDYPTESVKKGYKPEVVVVKITQQKKEIKAIGYPIKQENAHNGAQESHKIISASSTKTKTIDSTVKMNGDLVEEVKSDHKAQNGCKEDVSLKPVPLEETKDDGTAKEQVVDDQSVDNQPEVLVPCEICGVPVSKVNVYENPGCKHCICAYCIKDNDYRGRDYCLLQRCYQTLIKGKIKKFIEDFDKRQQQEEEEFLKISKKNSGTSQNKEEQKSPAKSSPKKPTTAECDYCFIKKDTDKLFINPCGHSFCVNCIQNKVTHNSKYCPEARCYGLFDFDGADNFIVQVMIEEQVSSKVTCISCKEEIELHYSKSAKPEHYQCQKCNTAICLKHENVMSECLCRCDQCLEEMELNIRTMIKFCKKCSKGLCSLCGERKTSDEACACLCANCFEKKSHLEDKLCHSCSAQTEYCPVCFDNLDEGNEHRQMCGHRICVRCTQDIFEIPSYRKPYACPICTQLKPE